MRNLKLNNIFWLLIFCIALILQTSFLTAADPKLKESLIDDMQYYEKVVKPMGRNAQINFLNRVIQKYEDKGIAPMYLTPIEEKLRTLQEKPVQRRRLNDFDGTDIEDIKKTRETKNTYGFCDAYGGIIFNNDVYENGSVAGIKLGILGSVVGGSLDVDYIDTETKNGSADFTMFPISVSFIVLPAKWLSFNVGGGYYIIDYSYNSMLYGSDEYYRDYWDDFYLYYYWTGGSWNSYAYYFLTLKEKFENSFGFHAGIDFDIPIYKGLSFGINTKYLILKPTLNTTGTLTESYYFYNKTYTQSSWNDDYWYWDYDYYYEYTTTAIKTSEEIDLSSLVLTGGLKFKF
ncbi:MAG: hypothetical protein JW983_04725 [Elusimicrobia bacterium]|nr:hypothetical protein [Elusimicrobiota bacterium]